jgi:hypothetical protein
LNQLLFHVNKNLLSSIVTKLEFQDTSSNVVTVQYVIVAQDIVHTLIVLECATAIVVSDNLQLLIEEVCQKLFTHVVNVFVH